MSKRYRLAVFICRCQPPHKGHIHVINEGLRIADRVLILIGSAFKPADVKNPWSWQFRAGMIWDCFDEPTRQRIDIADLEDSAYNEQKWVARVQEQVKLRNVEDCDICLIGHHKDDSSYYLDMFPQWDLVDVGNHKLLNSTDIRNVLFEHGIKSPHWVAEHVKMHPRVVHQIEQYTKSDEYTNLLGEKQFYQLHSDM